MPFEPRLLTVAKDADHPGENQDACRVDPHRGRAAIADGVATAIFARRWAEILTEAALADLPDPDQKQAFASWLAGQRRLWAEGIDESHLAWFQKPKMKQGAFSTLLWMWLEETDPVRRGSPTPPPVRRGSPTPPEQTDSVRRGSPTPPEQTDSVRRGSPTPPEPPTERLPNAIETRSTSPPSSPAGITLRALAIGDSCLLHVRGGRVLSTFPIQKSAELEADPLALGSLDLGRDAGLVFQRLETPCREGDLIVLCTDAVAAWLLGRLEQDQPIPWNELACLTEDQWRGQVCALRESGQMRYDDATLAVLRVVETRAPAAEASVVAGLPTVPPSTPRAPPLTPHAPLPTPDAAGPPPLAETQPIELDLPPEESHADWKARLKSLSEEFAAQVGGQLARGLEQLKKAKHSADEALRRYRDKRRPPGPNDRGE